jgi:hypothetical protein
VPDVMARSSTFPEDNAWFEARSAARANQCDDDPGAPKGTMRFRSYGRT